MSGGASISVTEEFYLRAQKAARERGITLQDLIRLACPSILARPQRPPSGLDEFRAAEAERKAIVAAARRRTNGRHGGSTPDRPTLNVSAATYDRIAAAAKQRGCSKARIVREACAPILEPEPPR